MCIYSKKNKYNLADDRDDRYFISFYKRSFFLQNTCSFFVGVKRIKKLLFAQ